MRPLSPGRDGKLDAVNRVVLQLERHTRRRPVALRLITAKSEPGAGRTEAGN